MPTMILNFNSTVMAVIMVKNNRSNYSRNTMLAFKFTSALAKLMIIKHG